MRTKRDSLILYGGQESHFRSALKYDVTPFTWDIPVRAVLVPVYRYTGNSTLEGPFSDRWMEDRIVLGTNGGIEAEFHNERLILQSFSSSTRLARFCTSPSSHFSVFHIIA